MNKHILIVMKWMKDPESVSREALKINKEVAHVAYVAHVAHDAYAAHVAHDAYAACVAYAAADSTSTYGDVKGASYWVDEYFKASGDNRKDYKASLSGESHNTSDKADEVYNMLMNGQFIDHQSPHSDYPSSLKYTCDLMGWYSLENEFQTAINKVFNGEMTAQEFKEYSARILAEKIAEEMIEEEEE